MMRFGVHCSVRKGLSNALEEAHRLGCDTLQIFTHSPRLWRAPRVTPEDADRFHARRQALGLYPLVVHTPYLPNLCTIDERMYVRSNQALRSDMEICERIRADFLVIHPGAYSEGSHLGEAIARMAKALNHVLAGGGKTTILIENLAGGGRRIGDRFEHLRDLMARIDHQERVGFCLDTAHTLGSGYGFSSAEEVEQTLGLIERTLGLAKVSVIHANDSKAPRGSHRDLHQHIGDGYIGREAFSALLRDKRLAGATVILETPKDNPDSDAKNLQALRALADRV
jgi:deoxyribonuclease-4